jgi:cytoskeleton protein RodZ
MPDQEPQGQGGASELATFGEDLRREREIRGISLKEIADATKISRRFLDAIERNDHLTLPAPVFTRGFVREYARYVGLSTEEIVDRYNHAVEHDDRIEKPPQVQKYAATPPRDISPRPSPKRGIPLVFAGIDRNLISALLIIVALSAVAWWAVQYKRNQETAQEPPAEAVPLTPVTASAAVPVPAQPAPADDTLLDMTVEAVDDSWVTLDADGETVLNAEMVAGDRRTFEAREGFRFRTIGNAAGLRLTIEGFPVPSLGSDGQVIRNRVFDREILAELRAAASAPANATQP